MASFSEILLWLLKKGVVSVKDSFTGGGWWDWIKSGVKSIKDSFTSDGGWWEWIKEHKIASCLIAGGALVIAIPLVIGFGPAGPILGSIAAGWQAGIGAVAAGSLFATLQSMAMTGAFTGIGAGLIGSGGLLKLIESGGGRGNRVDTESPE